ncbi:hypothetical protein [Dyella sp. 20L07]|uniref:hypothetical protein n=1 Tax=Dyella sp. 20L07 TaxID=3384240 RepID=UPI003D27E3CC
MTGPGIGYRSSLNTKVYRTSWIWILFIVFLLVGSTLVPYKPVKVGVFFHGVNLLQWALRLTLSGALLLWLVYMWKFGLTLSSDRLVIGAFKKREILFSEIVAVSTGSYKGSNSARFTLRNGKGFSIDDSMSGYKEVLETIKGSMS